MVWLIIGIVVAIVAANWLFDSIWENTIGRLFTSWTQPKKPEDLDRFSRGTGDGRP